MARTYETSEDAIEGFLQTHYYKCLEDKMFNFLPKFLEDKFDIKILSANPDYNEICGYHKDFDITIKVGMPEINKTSVDIFISSRYLFEFGKTKKIIDEIFTSLGLEFEFLGCGLMRDK
jgi:hypothetical protein